MMKIMSKTRLLVIALVMVVFMVASATFASAAPAEATAMDYTGTTREEAIATLQSAMEKVEGGEDVVLTLKSDMFFDAEARDFITIGTEKTSDATLYIQSELDGSGVPMHSITVGLYSTLHFAGNVTFENIILDRDANDEISYFRGSIIFVTEGKGKFVENIINPNSDVRAAKVSLAGEDLEVYSGNYMTIAPNFNSTLMTVDSPEIIFGGTAKCEHLAGRGVYTNAAAKTTGASNLTVKESASVTSILTAGYLYPEANISSALEGDATLNFEGGAAHSVYYIGYGTNGGSQGIILNKNAAGEKSKYTINFSGGSTSGVHAAYYMNKAVEAIKYYDLTVNYGATGYTNYVYGGVYLADAITGVEVKESVATLNLDGATFSSAFFGGAFIATTKNVIADKFIVDVGTTINIAKNSSVVFKDIVNFGSRVQSSLTGSASKIICAEIKGDTTIVANAAAGRTIEFSDKMFHCGSYLASQYAEHTGNITVTMSEAAKDNLKLTGSIRYMGCYLNASNTKFSGKVVATLDGKGHNIFRSANPNIALADVTAGLTNVTLNVDSDISVSGFHTGSPIIGGCVLASPVKNTSSYKLTIKSITLYGGTPPQPNVQFYGGDIIRHTGVNDDSTATSHLYIAGASQYSNPNALFFGGSRIESAGTTSINSTLSFANTAISHTLYGGSDIRAAGKHAGTSTLVLPEGSWGGTFTAPEVFGGSRIIAGGEQSGDSLVTSYKDAPLPTAETNDINDEHTIYAGSNLSSNGAKHSGGSKVIFGVNGENTKESYVRQDTYGGSKITANAEHSGSSEIVVDYAKIQGTSNVFGGSYLGVAGAKQSGPSALTINERVSTSTKPVMIFGGSYIAVDGAAHTGSSTFELNEGTIDISKHGAGSYAVTKATDTDANDGIVGGFAQGSVYYIINDGKVSKTPYICGMNVNVDGDVNVIITGGQIDGIIATVSYDTAQTTSIKGNSVLKISGGTFTQDFYNGCYAQNPAADTNLVTGTYYTEFVNDEKGEDIVFAYKKTSDSDTRTALYFSPVGRSKNSADYATSSVYVKYVGDFCYYKDGVALLINNWTSLLGNIASSKRFQDFTQYTGNNDRGMSFGSATLFKPMTDLDITVAGIDPATATLSDYILKNDDVLSWNSQSNISISALTAYDSFTEYKNAPVFVDAVTGGAFTTSTTGVKLQIGTAKSATIALGEKALEQLETVKVNYALIGTSIRLENLAMRCRAKISKTFFDADGITAADMGGYKIAKIGMLVGTTNKAPYIYGGANCIDAWVYKDGALNSATGNGRFGIDDEKYEGYFLYQAAVSGYEKDGVIDTARAKTTVYFRGYIILEDIATGVQTVVYLDSPVTGAGQVNYGKTLVKAAQDVLDETPSWVERLGQAHKTKFDAILAVAN